MALDMYAWLKNAYVVGMADIDQCKRAVEKNKLTKEQFKEVTNIDYDEYLKQNK